jgi:3-phenylpropionate/trans-cinnamate dioxygenase ferredoxin reductase subunit
MGQHQRGCVVVGAGLAAATTIQTLRDEGFDDPITLIGEEVDRPYERPPLSKEYLQGRTDLADLYVHPNGWYHDHAVDTHFGQRALGIDRNTREVHLRAGQAVGYQQLVLTTGSSPRTLNLPGTDLAGIHTLRTIADANNLQTILTPGRRLVIIGAGWIGLEIAAAARMADCQVTVLEAATVPLRNVLGQRLGEYFAQMHRQRGVDLRTATRVLGIRGRGGQVTGVDTESGQITADAVLVAAGATPNTGLADAAGLHVDNGIVVDDQLRSSDKTIFAAGDVANAEQPTLGRRLRVEHWDNAIRQGNLVAKTILGRNDRYDWQPYFFTDQYDLGMEYVGRSDPKDEVVIRGDLDDGIFVTFWTRHDTVTAAMNVNLWDVNDDLRRLIGRRIPTDRLRDPTIELAEL